MIFYFKKYFMKILILLCNRFSKFLGNVSKIFLGYPFHFLFPKKRFSIPKYSQAFIKSSSQADVLAIPKKIWQTNYSNKVSLPVYLNYLFNRLMSLSYEYHYVSTEDRLTFIKTHASKEILAAYERLNDGAAQADLWRLLVLEHFGGVYIDIDAHLVFPLAKIIQKNDKELFIIKDKKASKIYTNYFLATQKNHPVIQATIKIIQHNIDTNKLAGVFSLTGPIPFNAAIVNTAMKINNKLYRYVCVQGSFTNEYFQYIDKPNGKWTHKKPNEILK